MKKVTDWERTIMEIFREKPRAKVAYFAKRFEISSSRITSTIRSMTRKGLLQRKMVVYDPEEQRTFLVTLVANGPGPDLCFFRRLAPHGVRIVEAWHNFAGSVTNQGHLADGYTLLVKSRRNDEEEVFRQFVEMLTDAAIDAGYSWSHIHRIPLHR